jgi:hypothetical protein
MKYYDRNHGDIIEILKGFILILFVMKDVKNEMK